jgi:hypothetical protein
MHIVWGKIMLSDLQVSVCLSRAQHPKENPMGNSRAGCDHCHIRESQEISHHFFYQTLVLCTPLK